MVGSDQHLSCRYMFYSLDSFSITTPVFRLILFVVSISAELIVETVFWSCFSSKNSSLLFTFSSFKKSEKASFL